MSDTPQPGHNSGIASDRLRSFVERIEKLEEEKAALGSDIREVYAEAKSAGFDAKILRQVVRLRKLDAAERQEQEALLDLYKHALGMLADTPLGESALQKIAEASARENIPGEENNVTIKLPGHAPIRTSTAAMQRAADRLERRK